MREQLMQFHVDRHAYQLTLLLDEMRRGSNYSYYNSTGYLEIAQSISLVEIATHKFDEGTAYCGIAYDNQEERSLRLEKIYTELTKFLYTFMAYEALVSELHPEQKITGSRTAMIRNSLYEFGGVPAFHIEHTERLIKMVKCHLPDKIKDISRYFNDSEEYKVSKSNRGILIISEIRNDFIHGSSFHGSHSKQKEDECMVWLLQLSRRIIMNTMQMILFIKNQDRADEELSLVTSFVGENEAHIKFSEIVCSLSLYNSEYHNDHAHERAFLITSRIRKAGFL